MTLRHKTLLAGAIAAAICLLGVYLLARFVLLRDYESLDSRRLQQQAVQAHSLLVREAQQLHSLAQAVAFNLANEETKTLHTTGLRDLVDAVAADLLLIDGDPTQRPMPPTLSSPDNSPNVNWFLLQQQLSEGAAGLLMVDGDPWMLAVAAAVDSPQQRRPRLLLGRRLSEAQLEHTGQLIGARLNLVSRQAMDARPAVAQLVSVSQPLQQNLPLDNILGQPTLILSVEAEPIVASRGHQSVSLLLFGTLLLLGLILLASLHVFECQFFRRLQRLNGRALQLANSHLFGPRFVADERDELRSLSANLKRLAQLLESQRRTLTEERQRLDALIEAVPGLVGFRDAEGRWHRLNRNGLALLGLEATEVLGYSSAQILSRYPHLIDRLIPAANGQPADAKRYIEAGDTEVTAQAHRAHFQLSEHPLPDAHHNGSLLIGFAAVARNLQSDTLPSSKDTTTTEGDATLEPNERTDKALTKPTVSQIACTEAAISTGDPEREPARTLALIETLNSELGKRLGRLQDSLTRLPMVVESPQLRQVADDLRDTALAIQDLLVDSLDIARLEAGKLVPQRASLDLAAILETLCLRLKPLAVARGVQLSLFTDPRLPCPLLGDSRRLQQILYPLTWHAIMQASEQVRGGRVRLSAEPAGSDSINLVVADNGPGLTRPQQQRLFELEAPETAPPQGASRLALHKAWRLVPCLGGRLDVDGAVGYGTAFSLTLPALIDTAFSEQTTETPDLDGLYCLVMSRDPVQAADWCVYLADAGAQTEPFQDLTELQLRLAQRNAKPCLLAVDDSVPLDWIDELDSEARPPLLRACHLQAAESGGDRPGRLSIDGNALSRCAFLRGVAAVAGRQAPDRCEPVAWNEPKANSEL